MQKIIGTWSLRRYKSECISDSVIKSWTILTNGLTYLCRLKYYNAPVVEKFLIPPSSFVIIFGGLVNYIFYL